MTIEIAGRYFDIAPRYGETADEYSYYAAECPQGMTAVPVAVSDGDILHGMTLAGRAPTPADGEIVAIRQKISDELTKLGRCLIHGGALEYLPAGRCILFMGDSGVGKTTQLMNWAKKYRSECRIINGDKPAFGVADGRPYVFPSPWNGKEGIRSKKGAPLGLVVFLEQAGADELCTIPHDEKILRIFHQMFTGEKTRESYTRLVPFIEAVDGVPCVKLRNLGTERSAAMLREYAVGIFGEETI